MRPARAVSPSALPFRDLDARHPGLTTAIAASYAEAARVCLDRHHLPPQDFKLSNEADASVVRVEWQPTDGRLRAAWANELDATEAGAYAFALAACEVALGLVAVRRAETRTGADYYLAPQPGARVDDLEDSIRLEVSGVDGGSDGVVRARLQEKLAQAARGNSNLPALASVVGFRVRAIEIQRVVGP